MEFKSVKIAVFLSKYEEEEKKRTKSQPNIHIVHIVAATLWI